ncbi:NaeI family type II restriction endonuclease [Achromobacter mucicolens]|uniref:NaeI family type II restriction endonuclease n=1 Tax=Achromobacter mucicolens TaxID=1389922 RepID=UPI003208A74A
MQTTFPLNISEPCPHDAELMRVKEFLLAKPDLASTFRIAVRKAFDEVIDGPRTGRYCIEDLEKTEKTYIGTKVEIIVRAELELERGAVLDNLIVGQEVDTKFSVTKSWMIPREAIGKLCLLVSGNDATGELCVGLLRMTPDVLTNGANQDGKKSISAFGKSQIVWLVRDRMLPNFLLSLPDSIRQHVLSRPSGMQRVSALFKSVTNRLIPRSAVEHVAQQKDPMRRARQMKVRLAAEGYTVLCAKYEHDRSEILRYGFSNFDIDDWLSIRDPKFDQVCSR